MQPRREQLTEAQAARAADVFTTHQRFLERVIRKHASPDHIPDIVQAVGMKICHGLTGFRDEAALTTWLYRVAVNESRTYYRRERRQHLAVENIQATPVPEPYLDPDEHVQAIERQAALNEAIDNLSPFHRDLMRNHLTEGLVEFGSKTSRHRARQRLRELLADDPRLDS